MEKDRVPLPTHYELLHRGLGGQADLIPSDVGGQRNKDALPRHTVPVGLPPVLPDVKEQLEEFLLHPEDLPTNDYEKAQRFWPRQMEPESLYSADVCPVATTIKVDRNPTTGELLGFSEEVVRDAGSTTSNSTSLRRPPGPLDQQIRGSTTNYPFWPGGLDEPDLSELKVTDDTSDLDLEHDLLTSAPGLPSGNTLPQKSLSKMLQTGEKKVSVLKLQDILAQGDELDFGEDEEQVEVTDKATEQEPRQNGPTNTPVGTDQLDELVKVDSTRSAPKVITLSSIAAAESKKDYEFAIWIDVKEPVDDFHRRIPDMAYKWPFELDIFQKQAVLHLEAHDNVFVAAHTSAGKTVVAEYAIALSMKHMTKTIYTSPIKALSNQKFRDFKTTFEDVGLITGDVQIKAEASCLIMTTEILRSMLYNGSEVIRDLEWVIFDEVHYINDSERGVVWEEVLIMLPDHVNIILLSATVPNCMEFADWVGRTKKRKVYVVSTTKRPVPLEHYLYTGNSAKTSNELFMIVDKNKKFLTAGYHKALDAKKERASKSSQSFGAKGPRGGDPRQEKNIWLSVIQMLQKKDKLPIVAFTFSKKRIDENIGHLSSLDLLTQSEKSEVHIFVQKCIARLKEPDRKLPQVKEVSDMLKRGIGKHHSGILPILKEVVEMLFCKGLVKVLFATETFAMGVNAPARTVVFDSIRKHDGMNFRDLLPGEYIQMAGRAGRRGLDTTGTVIILAKGDVPEMSDLHRMMLGKPTQLESQFRLTYSMILNLLRVEQLQVQDMMKRSFSEFHNQRDAGKRQAILDGLKAQLKELPEVVDYSGDLEQYYLVCDEYWRLKSELQKVILSHPQGIKMLTAGRVVVVDTAKHKFTLGVILQPAPGTSKERSFTALVLCDLKQPDTSGWEEENPPQDATEEETSLPRPIRQQQLFHPEGACGHEVITVKPDDITAITTKSLKISADKIVDDYKKRQIPRFRHDPPGQSTSVCTQELLRLVESSPEGLPSIDPVRDLHLRDMDLVDKFHTLQGMEASTQHFQCTKEANFTANFNQLKKHMKINEQCQDIQFLLSDESLQLLPEYQQRIEVLRSLKYIDQSNTVQLKGRVACEISSHELIITELVLEGVLTELHPTEIAALLSCVVFEQRRASEPNLAPTLEKAKENFISVARMIGERQRDCGMRIPVEDYVEQFHFGLLEVVFEWARGMPFAEITGLTDVQEGIIVRSIQRLDEVLRDVRNAARIIGDTKLYGKMEEASTLVKRDIVFAASLYTQ